MNLPEMLATLISTYMLTGSNQTLVQLDTTQISSWLDEDQGIPEPA